MNAFLRSLVRRAACAWRPRTLVLAYHHVCEPGRTAPDVTTPPARFAEHVAHLVRSRLVVPLDRLLSDLRGGGPRGGTVLLTIDDAAADTWEVAYPILRDAGAPATVFVPTGLVGARRPFWWNRLHLLGQAARAKGIDVGSLFAQEGSGRGGAAADRWESVRWLDDPRRERVLDLIAELLGADAPAAGPMGWDEVAALDRSGLITLGGHTIGHPPLAGLDDAAIEAEAAGGREALARFASFRPVFAYPYGDPDAVDERVKRAVRRAGFEFGFTTDQMTLSGAEDRMSLGRVCVGDVDLDEFRWMIDHFLRNLGRRAAERP